MCACISVERESKKATEGLLALATTNVVVLVVVTRQKGVTYAKYDKLYFCLMFNTQRINNGKMSNSNGCRTTPLTATAVITEPVKMPANHKSNNNTHTYTHTHNNTYMHVNVHSYTISNRLECLSVWQDMLPSRCCKSITTEPQPHLHLHLPASPMMKMLHLH